MDSHVVVVNWRWASGRNRDGMIRKA